MGGFGAETLLVCDFVTANVGTATLRGAGFFAVGFFGVAGDDRDRVGILGIEKAGDLGAAAFGAAFGAAFLGAGFLTAAGFIIGAGFFGAGGCSSDNEGILGTENFGAFVLVAAGFLAVGFGDSILGAFSANLSPLRLESVSTELSSGCDKREKGSVTSRAL